MSTLSNRIDKLEAKVGLSENPINRVIPMVGGGQSATEIDTYLGTIGIEHVNDDLIIMLCPPQGPVANGPIEKSMTLRMCSFGGINAPWHSEALDRQSEIHGPTE